MMARIRTMKPAFFLSEKVQSLPFSTQMLFIGTWLEADDDGRYRVVPAVLKGAIFPLRPEITEIHVEEMLNDLGDAVLIDLYVVDGRRYLRVRNFREHQRINRPTPSTLPDYPQGVDFRFDSLRTHGGLTEDFGAEVHEMQSTHSKPHLVPVGNWTHGGLTEGSLSEGKGREGNKPPQPPRGTTPIEPDGQTGRGGAEAPHSTPMAEAALGLLAARDAEAKARAAALGNENPIQNPAAFVEHRRREHAARLGPMLAELERDHHPTSPQELLDALDGHETYRRRLAGSLTWAEHRISLDRAEFERAARVEFGSVPRLVESCIAVFNEANPNETGATA